MERPLAVPGKDDRAILRLVGNEAVERGQDIAIGKIERLRRIV